MTYAVVCKELNEYHRALELVGLAERIYREVKHVQLSSCLCYKAEILLAQGEVSEAENAIEESISGENSDRAKVLLSDVKLQQRKYQESRAVIQEVLASSSSSALPHFRVKHAEKIKKRCDREIFKHHLYFIFKLLAVVVLLISVFLGIWYSVK